MKLRKILYPILATVALPLFGNVEIAIKVDGNVIAKETVIRVARAVFSTRNKMVGVGEEVEVEVIREVVRDMEYWMIAFAEGARRGVKPPQQSEDLKNIAKMVKEQSKYYNLDDESFKLEGMAAFSAYMILTADGVAMPKTIDAIRYEVTSRYRRNHQVEIADHTGWRVDRYRGRLVQDSKYNALEHELSPDSGKFLKAIYYAHHYTIRYYVMFQRWYISKSLQLVERFKGEVSADVVKWGRIILLYVIPYLFHVFLLVVYAKCRGRAIRLLSLLFWALVLSGVSTVLYYFGMSPYSLFVVFVGGPLAIFFMYIQGHGQSGGGSSFGGYSSYSSGGGTASGDGEVTTTYTDENGCEYKGKGENPDSIEKQTPGDHAIFDKSIDGSTYKERFGDREIKKPWGL